MHSTLNWMENPVLKIPLRYSSSPPRPYMYMYVSVLHAVPSWSYILLEWLRCYSTQLKWSVCPVVYNKCAFESDWVSIHTEIYLPHILDHNLKMPSPPLSPLPPPFPPPPSPLHRPRYMLVLYMLGHFYIIISYYISEWLISNYSLIQPSHINGKVRAWGKTLLQSHKLNSDKKKSPRLFLFQISLHDESMYANYR